MNDDIVAKDSRHYAIRTIARSSDQAFPVIFNRAELKPQFHPALDQVAGTMAEYSQTIVEVSGHTDDVGGDAYNQRLSEQRANSVANHLVGKGLIRERFEVIGMGERHPVAENTRDSGRARNRRVEIRVVPLTQSG